MWFMSLQVEQFWRFYSHMVRPGDLTGHSDFHLFKEGIKPMWEVSWNSHVCLDTSPENDGGNLLRRRDFCCLMALLDSAFSSEFAVNLFSKLCFVEPDGSVMFWQGRGQMKGVSSCACCGSRRYLWAVLPAAQ